MVLIEKTSYFLVLGYGSGAWRYFRILCIQNTIFRKKNLSIDTPINAVHPWTPYHNEPPWKFAGVDRSATCEVRSKYHFRCAIYRRDVALLYRIAYDRSAVSTLFGAIETFSVWDGAVFS